MRQVVVELKVRPKLYTHDIRNIWKVIIINVLIVISWTFLVTPHGFRVLITIEQGIAVGLVYSSSHK